MGPCGTCDLRKYSVRSVTRGTNDKQCHPPHAALSFQVYLNDPDEPPGVSYNRLVQLPRSSGLGPGYHQLLAYEFAGLSGDAVFGLLDGVDQFVANASLVIDRRMVLPPL